MVNIPVDATAFAVFDMQELSAETFDAGLESAADELAVVFFWGFECFNCEIVKKAMLAKPDEIRALGLKWFHSNVYQASRSRPPFHAAWRANVVLLLPGQAPGMSNRLAWAWPVRSRCPPPPAKKSRRSKRKLEQVSQEKFQIS